MRALRRRVPLVLLAALGAFAAADAGCSSEGPCQGQCPVPYAVKFTAAGGKGIDQGQPFVVDVTADGVHESLSCTFNGPTPQCTGSAADFTVVATPCNGGDCGTGIEILGSNTPTTIHITVTNAGTKVGDATLTLHYSDPATTCGCKTAGGLPGQTLS